MRYCILLSFAAIFLLTNLCLAGELKDPSNHFSISFPDEWKALTPKQLDKVREKTPDNVDMLHLMVLSGDICCAIQKVDQGSRSPYGRNSVQEFTRGMRDSVGPDATIEAEYDASFPALVGHVCTGDPGKAQHILNVAFPGKKVAICVIFYADGSNYQAHRDQFLAIAHSFHFDPGYGFAPPSATTGGVVLLVFVLAMIAFPVVLLALRRRLRGGKPAPVIATPDFSGQTPNSLEPNTHDDR